MPIQNVKIKRFTFSKFKSRSLYVGGFFVLIFRRISNMIFFIPRKKSFVFHSSLSYIDTLNLCIASNFSHSKRTCFVVPFRDYFWRRKKMKNENMLSYSQLLLLQQRQRQRQRNRCRCRCRRCRTHRRTR